MSNYLRPPSISPNWKNLLQPGDIVSYRFPVFVPLNGEESKRRPCLVLDIVEQNGVRSAVLAYGTSIKTKHQHNHQVRVRQPDSIKQAGLNQPTHFVGSHTITVPLNDPGFAICAATGAPVIGRLDNDLISRMEEVQSRLDPVASGAGHNAPKPGVQPNFAVETMQKPRRFTPPGAK